MRTERILSNVFDAKHHGIPRCAGCLYASEWTPSETSKLRKYRSRVKRLLLAYHLVCEITYNDALSKKELDKSRAMIRLMGYIRNM